MRDFIRENDDLRLLLQKDTATEMVLENGARIISLTEGNKGRSVRGFTADILILEEAGLLEDTTVNQAATPMLASKPDAQIIKIGTPLARNHFYKSCHDPKSKYTLLEVTWRECVKAKQYTQSFIDEQKDFLLDVEFQNEYEAMFIEGEDCFFPYELVKQCEDSELEYYEIDLRI